MKRLLITLLFVGMGCLAWAYDFSVAMQGYSLYFNILDRGARTVELTAPLESGNERWPSDMQPRGVLNLPTEVADNGVTYTVVAVGERAFAGCTAITSVVFPSTLTDIGAYAFYMCTGISGIIVIGEDIAGIGRGAFYGCSSITEVKFNAVECESMGGSRSSTVFGNCHLLTKITFGPRVRYIPDYAFVGMDGLDFVWNLPQSLEAVGEYAFAYCSNIRGTLVLPDRVRVVGPYAFAQCHSTTGIELPARLERVDQRAFHQCVGVKKVTVKAIVPPVAGNDIFSGISESAPIYVPCIGVGSYRSANGWSGYANIRPSGSCKIDVYARAKDPASGTVIGDGAFRVGDSATLVAVCNAGYGFKGWTDGNTDNPRRIRVVDTTSYTAIMERIEVVRAVEYVHDTTYKDGIEVVYRYYEINDVSRPIASQKEVTYDSKRQRLDVPVDKHDLVGVAVYNDAGQCVMTGSPKRGHINMRRFPSGYYIVRVSTIDDEQSLRFFHSKK